MHPRPAGGSKSARPTRRWAASTLSSDEQFIYNMEPRPGEPGLLATQMPLLQTTGLHDPARTYRQRLRARRDTPDIFHLLGLFSLQLWMWGVPTDPCTTSIGRRWANRAGASKPIRNHASPNPTAGHRSGRSVSAEPDVVRRPAHRKRGRALLQPRNGARRTSAGVRRPAAICSRSTRSLVANPTTDRGGLAVRHRRRSRECRRTSEPDRSVGVRDQAITGDAARGHVDQPERRRRQDACTDAEGRSAPRRSAHARRVVEDRDPRRSTAARCRGRSRGRCTWRSRSRGSATG